MNPKKAHFPSKFLFVDSVSDIADKHSGYLTHIQDKDLAASPPPQMKTYVHLM